jgi:hypothetical protein
MGSKLYRERDDRRGEVYGVMRRARSVRLPLPIYFAVTFTTGMLAGRRLGLGYPRSTTAAFTAAGNFELAIAVAIARFGVTSGQSARRCRRTPDRSAGPGRVRRVHLAVLR